MDKKRAKAQRKLAKLARWLTQGADTYLIRKDYAKRYAKAIKRLLKAA